MPRGPRGEQRPGDMIGCAVKVARIATGELADERTDPPPPSRQRRGGQARAEKLTAEERSEIARKAAAARWGSGSRQIIFLPRAPSPGRAISN